MSRTLLFGDDGSSGADIAWLWINSHGWPGWSIEVVNAGLQGGPPPPREAVRPDLADSVSTFQTTSDPRLVLHTRGADRDLVVIGARGRGFLKRMHLGSTAQWLMNGPPAPLVVARSGRRTRRVLLAHDGSDHARAAENALVSMPWIGDVSIRVLTVAEDPEPRDIAEAARERLAPHASEVDTRVLTPHDLPVFTRPRDVILDEAESWQADLIALGGRGATPWGSISEAGLQRAGSTATGVTAQAPVNVLLALKRP